MEKSESRSYEALPIRDVEAPYAGKAGITRFENVHLVQTDGAAVTIPVCRVVNVKTHPELAERAVAGTLHKLEDGRELALSFVYHDPGSCKFALVLPSVLAHAELKEWSRLMAEIADDTEHPVPVYVRDNTTVIGRVAFQRYVTAESIAPDSPLAASDVTREVESPDSGERERLLAYRERELDEHERALNGVAESLSLREGELLRREEQLETARADIEVRELELSAHVRALPDSPPLPASVSRIPPAQDEQESWTPVGVVSPSPPRRRADESDDDERAAQPEEDASSDEARHRPPPLPLVRYRPVVHEPPPLPLRQQGHAPPPLGLVRGNGVDHAPPLRNGADRAPLLHNGVDHVPLRSSVPPPLPHHHPVALASDKSPEPEVAPPAHFVGQRVEPLAVKLAADELWLFVHIDELRAAAFRKGIELYLQYAEIDRYPIVVVALLSVSQEGLPLRLTLDGYSSSDMRVLEHLSRSFRARVALYVAGAYTETLTVATLREGVAQAIGERLSLLPQDRPSISAHDAMLRVQREPPPLANDDLPFGPARREASTTATVLASVEQLSSWLRPEKLNEATLTYSVPRNVIDATIRRVLRAAVAFGIALPDELVQLAVEHRAARDTASLLRLQLQGFRQRVSQGENDLGATATRKNWERLLGQAAAHQVEVDDTTRLLASTAVVRSPPRVDATRPHRRFEGLTELELRARLQQQSDRLEALRELCVRGHAASLEHVLRALHAMEPEELPSAVANVVSFGEAAGDGLIAALQSPEPALRQLSALALGRLKLRRALLPLLKQLENENSEIQPELARALGEFGPAALRVLTRALVMEPRGQPERYIAALAHIANHGGAKEVERLENDADMSVAQVARKAMARRSRLEWEDLAVREQRSLGEGDGAAQLSQAFYAELTKLAI